MSASRQESALFSLIIKRTHMSCVMCLQTIIFLYLIRRHDTNFLFHALTFSRTTTQLKAQQADKYKLLLTLFSEPFIMATDKQSNRSSSPTQSPSWINELTRSNQMFHRELQPTSLLFRIHPVSRPDLFHARHPLNRCDVLLHVHLPARIVQVYAQQFHYHPVRPLKLQNLLASHWPVRLRVKMPPYATPQYRCPVFLDQLRPVQRYVGTIRISAKQPSIAYYRATTSYQCFDRKLKSSHLKTLPILPLLNRNSNHHPIQLQQYHPVKTPRFQQLCHAPR